MPVDERTRAHLFGIRGALLLTLVVSACFASRGHTYHQAGLSVTGGAIRKTGGGEFSVHALRARSTAAPITRFRYQAGLDVDGDRQLTDPPDQIQVEIDNSNPSPSVTVAEAHLTFGGSQGQVLVHAEVYQGSSERPVWSATWSG